MRLRATEDEVDNLMPAPICFSEKNVQPGAVSCVNIDAMTNDGRDEREGMDREDDAALWTLLGQQEPPVKASPYFSRQVMREIKLAEEQGGGGTWSRVRRIFARGGLFRHAAIWSGALSGACAVALVYLAHPAWVTEHRETAPQATAVPAQTIVAEATPETAVSQPVEAAQKSISAGDEEVIADLDNVLQREESRLWTEDTARF